MKKLILVLLILLILAIAISISPLAEYIYSLYAAEMPDDSTSAAVSDTVTDTAPITDAGNETVTPDQNAVLFAIVLSTVSVLAAAVIFIRKRNPEV